IRLIAKKVAKKAKSRERKLERYLESDERVEKPRSRWGMKLDFGPPPPGGRAVLRVEELTFSYEPLEIRDWGSEIADSERQSPLSNLQSPLLEDVNLEVQHGERIALVGPNGAGKTTLLRLIAGRLVPTAGRVRLGANIRLGMLAQEHETLDLGRTV